MDLDLACREMTLDMRCRRDAECNLVTLELVILVTAEEQLHPGCTLELCKSTLRDKKRSLGKCWIGSNPFFSLHKESRKLMGKLHRRQGAIGLSMKVLFAKNCYSSVMTLNKELI